MLTVDYAKDPIYTDAEGTCIHLMVKFTMSDGVVPFCAMVNDPEPHGRELFANAKNGMYGEVKPFFVDDVG